MQPRNSQNWDSSAGKYVHHNRETAKIGFCSSLKPISISGFVDTRDNINLPGGNPSLSRGRAMMQKTVIQTLTRGTMTWPDVCDKVIRVTLHCRESVVNWPFAAICSLSRLGVLAITRRCIDTVSCSNHCQLMCSRKCSLFLLFSWLRCKHTLSYSHVEYVCVRSWTSIYYIFITTRSYVVTSTPVGPSCSPLDDDERHDHPLLHASPGSQQVAQLLYRFWNRNLPKMVPPGRLTQISFKSVQIFVTIRGKTWQAQLGNFQNRNSHTSKTVCLLSVCLINNRPTTFPSRTQRFMENGKELRM